MRRNKSLRKKIISGKPDCALCGNPINYDATPGTPLAPEVDHIIPLALGGLDRLDNLQATHRACNQKKGIRTKKEPEPIHYEGKAIK